MLAVEHLAKTYGEGVHRTEAIGDLTFEVRQGEMLCIVGPSGCGKTTLLKCCAGLIPPTSGTVTLEGRPVDAPPEAMALVFQEYGRSLFPWMTVEQNVRFPLRRKRLAAPERDRLVTEGLRAVGLDQFHAHYPWELSGGMQQRVAIARALAYQPRILLMDEPFASVDAQTRSDLEDLLLRVWQEFEVTILFVTHDIDEAVYLADRVLVLSPRPTTVREAVEVELARPRQQLATKNDAEFARLRTHVYELIRGPQR